MNFPCLVILLESNWLQLITETPDQKFTPKRLLKAIAFLSIKNKYSLTGLTFRCRYSRAGCGINTLTSSYDIAQKSRAWNWSVIWLPVVKLCNLLSLSLRGSSRQILDTSTWKLSFELQWINDDDIWNDEWTIEWFECAAKRRSQHVTTVYDAIVNSFTFLLHLSNACCPLDIPVDESNCVFLVTRDKKIYDMIVHVCS